METYYDYLTNIFKLSNEIIRKALKPLNGLEVDSYLPTIDSVPSLKHEITNLVVFNSREEESLECFRFQTQIHTVAVMTADGDVVRCQVNPSLIAKSFEVVFCLLMPGLGTKKVSILKSVGYSKCVLAAATTNQEANLDMFPGMRKMDRLLQRFFVVRNRHVAVTFNTNDATPISLDLQTALPARRVPLITAFFSYNGPNSGAYIFAPMQEKAEPFLMTKPNLTFYDGPIEGGAFAQTPVWQFRHSLNKVSLLKFPHSKTRSYNISWRLSLLLLSQKFSLGCLNHCCCVFMGTVLYRFFTSLVQCPMYFRFRYLFSGKMPSALRELCFLSIYR